MPDMLLSKGFLGDSKQVIDVDFTKVVEGKIGRVLIRRSGQVEIQIADTKYVLDSMEMNPFKEVHSFTFYY